MSSSPARSPSSGRTRAGVGIAALAIVALCRSPLPAQSLPPLDEYRVRVFGLADGLPSSNVYSVNQTRDGYLVVATAHGLVRFDGHRFEPIPTPGISSIDWIHKDRRDRIWVHSWGNRVGVVRDGEFRLLPLPPGYPAGEVRIASMDAVRGVSLTADGSVWFGGFHGLLRANADRPDSFTRYTTADGLPSDTVLGLFDIAGERVAVTRPRLAVARPDSARPDVLRFVPIGPPCHVAADPLVTRTGVRLTCLAGSDEPSYLDYRNGTFTRTPLTTGLAGAHTTAANGNGAQPPEPDAFRAPWFGVRDWLGAEAPDHRSFFPNVNFLAGLTPAALRVPLPDGHLFGSVLLTRDRTLWFSVYLTAELPVFLMRERGGELVPIPLQDHLEARKVQDLFEDNEGNIWVSTERGLLQFSERSVFALTAKHGLADGFTAPIVQSRDGAVWIGSWGGGLHRFADGRLVNRYTVADGLPSDMIRGLHEADDGTIWVGTYRGTAALRDGRIVASRYSDYETRAFAEADGKVWAATDRGLLVGTLAQFAAGTADTALAGSFWALRVTRDGSLWIGGEQGLARFSDGRIRIEQTDSTTSAPFVTAIYQDAEGTLWLGTFANGLARLRDGRAVSITSRDGLSADGIWGIVEDGLGAVWLSSTDGIMRIDREQLRDFADARERGDDPGRLSAVVYRESEGLPNREANRGSPSAWRLRDGRLVFNNVAGAVVIDPARVDPPPPPVTALQLVSADGVPVIRPVRGAAGRIPAGTRQLQFDFAALSFASPEQNRYRYRLDGYDDAWVDAGAARRASYTGLHPGRYTFRVQGSTGIGEWGEAAAWSFAIPPLLWQAWWLRALAVTALFGVLASAYRYRVRKLLELERLRVRIAADLHDDIGANLSSIALLSQMLEKKQLIGERERRQIARIGVAAQETMGGLRDVIWLVDPAHDNLEALLARMRNTASNLLDGTRWTLRLPELVPSRRLPMALVRNTYLIYKEALTNAVRHGRAPHIEIDVAVDGNRLELRIEDDGVGFDAAAVRRGNGLGNLRRRAAEAGGELEIRSAPGAGTRVTFTADLP